VKCGLTKSWINDIVHDLSYFYDFTFFNTLESLKNELELKALNTNPTLTYVLIDIEDINYSLYTKSYFADNQNIKFIGIGYKKDIDEHIELIANNIGSYITIGNHSFEVVKALKYIDSGKPYFCEETKDHLLTKYINNIKFNSRIKNSNNLKNSIPVRENFSDIESLTEKEKKVCSLLVQGLTYKEISTLMGVTIFAINQNAKSIYKKLKVRSRGELSYRMSS
jgi:DNA-binding NarL/FixJ family response regulator